MPLVINENGATAQSLDEVIAEIDAELLSPENFGPDFVLDEAEIVPQIRAIFAGREVRVQQAVVALTKVLTPGEARGVWQDNLLDLSGLQRLGETHSTVLVELHGPSPGTVPADRIYRHEPTQTLWDQPSPVTMSGTPSIGQTTLVAQQAGPIDIVASDAWTVIVGDPAVISLESIAQSEAGRLVETDEAAEERRVEDLGAAGSTTHPAIRADMLEWLREAGYEVDEVSVEVDRVAHTVEVLIDDNGSIPDDVVAQAVWETVGAGPDILGDESGQAVDVSGRTHTVAFSRVGQVEVWVRITLGTSGAEASLGDTDALFPALEQAVVDYAAPRHRVGRDVIPLVFWRPVQDNVPEGSVTSIVVELSLDGSSWGTSVLSIGATDRAVFALERTTVQ